jgi:hypothetical protein
MQYREQGNNKYKDKSILTVIKKTKAIKDTITSNCNPIELSVSRLTQYCLVSGPSLFWIWFLRFSSWPLQMGRRYNISLTCLILVINRSITFLRLLAHYWLLQRRNKVYRKFATNVSTFAPTGCLADRSPYYYYLCRCSKLNYAE